MRILEVIPNHQFVKEWDNLEINLWSAYAAMIGHMVSTSNPHSVNASQVAAAGPWASVQEHISDQGAHHYYDTRGPEMFEYADIVEAGTDGVLTLGNTNPSRKEVLVIGGHFKAPDDNLIERDYAIDRTSEPTLLRIHEYEDFIDIGDNIQVFYEERV